MEEHHSDDALEPAWTVYSCWSDTEHDTGYEQGVFEVWEVGEQVCRMRPDDGLLHLEYCRKLIGFAPNLKSAAQRGDWGTIKRILNELQ